MRLFIKEDNMIIFKGIIAELELKKAKTSDDNQINIINAKIEVLELIKKQLIIIKNEI